MSDDLDPRDKKVAELQNKIRELREELAATRREMPPEPVEDYALTGADGAPVRLSELFGEKSELVVIHNMGSRCPMCTTWADGFNGILHHIEDRMAFVVSTPDAPDAQREFAEGRGWKMRMLSTQGSPFATDMKMAGEHEGKQMLYPGLSVFQMDGDNVVRVAADYFGPGDVYCSLWSIFDLFPTGQGDWWPSLTYPT